MGTRASRILAATLDRMLIAHTVSGHFVPTREDLLPRSVQRKARKSGKITRGRRGKPFLALILEGLAWLLFLGGHLKP